MAAICLGLNVLHKQYGFFYRFKAINGELLYEIRKMQRQAPEHFYITLKTELGLDFLMVLKFTKALDRL